MVDETVESREVLGDGPREVRDVRSVSGSGEVRDVRGRSGTGGGGPGREGEVRLRRGPGRGGASTEGTKVRVLSSVPRPPVPSSRLFP